MKIFNPIKTLFLGALLAVAPLTSSATALYSYLAPVRTEITNQLFMVTNTAPVNTRLAGSLKAALRLIDRPTATNLSTDVTTLNNLYNSLSRLSLSNTFVPLLDTAGDNYYTVIYSSYTNLLGTWQLTLPSGTRTAASNNLSQLSATLNAASQTNVAAGLKLLSKAVAKLKVATTLVTRANAVTLGNKVSATIAGAGFGVTGAIGAGHPSGVLANYSSSTHILGITGSKFSGGVQLFTLNIGAVTEGTTTHSFSNSEALLVFTKTTITLPPVHKEWYSTSGSVTVTLNSAKKVAYGSFEVAIKDSNNNPSTAKGTFAVNFSDL
jgi:hypothetical protein